MTKPLTLRALNRATLARQMLLAREKIAPLRAIERLVALQAQAPKPPFLGLWSRIQRFEREHLTRLFLARKVVRSTTLRCTIHTMTAEDYLGLRAAIQPALSHTTRAILRRRMKGVGVERLLGVARGFFAERPATFDALREFLARRYPNADVRALAYVVRTHLPLVQVPTDAAWGFPGSADFALADTWLQAPVVGDAGLEPLALRYLAAFRPGDARRHADLVGPAARHGA